MLLAHRSPEEKKKERKILKERKEIYKGREIHEEKRKKNT